jgi:hypothetical protein
VWHRRARLPETSVFAGDGRVVDLQRLVTLAEEAGFQASNPQTVLSVSESTRLEPGQLIDRAVAGSAAKRYSGKALLKRLLPIREGVGTTVFFIGRSTRGAFRPEERQSGSVHISIPSFDYMDDRIVSSTNL